MTFEEVIAFYRTSGDPYLMRAKVWRRDDLSNTETGYRGTGSCWTNGPRSDMEVCVCGLDMVRSGCHCITCGRPWWCER